MSEVAKVFDKVASDYDTWYLQPKGRQVFDAESRAVEVMIPHEGVGLEIGAGTGIFADELTNVARTVICLDLSRGMVREARGRGLYTVLGSAARLPIRSGCLDFVCLITVIEFLKEPTAVYLEASKTLKPRASIVTLFINRLSDWGALYLKMAENNDPIFTQANIYDEEAVWKFMDCAGLRVSGAVGTLNLRPCELGDEELTSPSERSGVIVLQAQAKT